MDQQHRQSDRREFIKIAGAATALTALHCTAGVWPGGCRPQAANRAHRLRRTRHRRGGRRADGCQLPDQAGRDGRRVSAPARRKLRRARAAISGEARSRSRARGQASLSASTPTRRRWMRCDRATSRSWPLRWRFAGLHFQYAIDRGPERLHGEADRRRQRSRQADARPGEEGRRKESESCASAS